MRCSIATCTSLREAGEGRDWVSPVTPVPSSFFSSPEGWPPLHFLGDEYPPRTSTPVNLLNSADGTSVQRIHAHRAEAIRAAAGTESELRRRLHHVDFSRRGHGSRLPALADKLLRMLRWDIGCTYGIELETGVDAFDTWPKLIRTTDVRPEPGIN